MFFEMFLEGWLGPGRVGPDFFFFFFYFLFYFCFVFYYFLSLFFHFFSCLLTFAITYSEPSYLALRTCLLISWETTLDGHNLYIFEMSIKFGVYGEREGITGNCNYSGLESFFKV